MAYEEDDDSFEHTLLVVREVAVYKIPPRSSSGGYKCGEWLQSDKIWSGRLRLVSMKDKCEVRLEDSNTGELFACCPVLPGKRDATVEGVTDSSRYFVLRIDDGRGKHAFIGLGFAERNEAFDFNVALSDHEKYAKRASHNDRVEDDESSAKDSESPLDLRLKEGETIRINVKARPSSGTGMLSAGSSSIKAGSLASVGRMKAPLAPPPGGGRIRSPLPPPPNDIRSTKSGGSLFGSSANNSLVSSQPNASNRPTDLGRQSRDAFADLSELELSLPTGGVNTSKNQGSGWAAF